MGIGRSEELMCVLPDAAQPDRQASAWISEVGVSLRPPCQLSRPRSTCSLGQYKAQVGPIARPGLKIGTKEKTASLFGETRSWG